MKAVAIALVLLGFIAGCARLQSMHQSMQASMPPAPRASATDRPDLVYPSPSDCEKAGRTWNGTSGVCM
jgi:hypothetical protein